MFFVFKANANSLIQNFENNLYPKYINSAGNFIQIDMRKSHYYYIENPNESLSQKLTVIVPGHREAGLKYFELADQLSVNVKNDILIIDHPGQGFSQRPLPNQYKLHVESFNLYIKSFIKTLKEVLKKKTYQEITIIAHSKGALVSLEAMKELSEIPIKEVFFTSPMFDFQTLGIPRFIAKSLAGILSKIGLSKSYAFGQSDYKKKNFHQKNNSTTSQERYEFASYINTKFPYIVSSGSTFKWVYQSLLATDKVLENLNKVEVPVMIFQAGDDEIVQNKKQNQVCELLKKCRIYHYKKAKHDIIHEVDSIRNDILTKIKNKSF